MYLMGFESPHTGRGTCEGDTLGFSRRNQLMRRCCAKPGFPRQTIPRLLLMRQDITTLPVATITVVTCFQFND